MSGQPVPGAAVRITIGAQCMGSGNCAYVAPQTFDLDDDTGRAVVLDPPHDPHPTILAAARGCPTRAIALSGSAE